MKTPIRTDPFIFRWRVSEAGYQWAKGIIDGKPHLIRRFEAGKGYREIEPPKEAFAEFAQLEPTQDSIREFASKRGDLFDQYSEPDHVSADGNVSGGASLKRWQSAIGDMRVLVQLWENIRRRRLSHLKSIVRWQTAKDGHSSVTYVIETPTRSANHTLAHSRISYSAMLLFPNDSKGLLFAARCALREEINFRLSEHQTVPSLAWTPDYDYRLIFKPPHLLAALWLQFAQAVTGTFRIKRCICGCGKFFQTGPGGRRDDADTYDAACRQRIKRERENAEYKLAAERGYKGTIKQWRAVRKKPRKSLR